ncbi:unnamed protein product [Cyprideis torosa]|uniref:Uncharacterized protein n=1 Tax=Cyprideis torosa TaxID=163714 RepID=A0A7R8W7K8_9CRUS|nr:unnamed protein product [Cyprideis torosa]CAG0885291.1 unnamed protein product [Cyprideis torosa]
MKIPPRNIPPMENSFQEMAPDSETESGSESPANPVRMHAFFWASVLSLVLVLLPIAGVLAAKAATDFGNEFGCSNIGGLLGTPQKQDGKRRPPAKEMTFGETYCSCCPTCADEEPEDVTKKEKNKKRKIEEEIEKKKKKAEVTFEETKKIVLGSRKPESEIQRQPQRSSQRNSSNVLSPVRSSKEERSLKNKTITKSAQRKLQVEQDMKDLLLAYKEDPDLDTGTCEIREDPRALTPSKTLEPSPLERPSSPPPSKTLESSLTRRPSSPHPLKDPRALTLVYEEVDADPVSRAVSVVEAGGVEREAGGDVQA